MSGDLTAFSDFLDDDDGFLSPPMPSTAHPEGKQYRILSPNAKVGLRLNALADIMAKREAGGPTAITEKDIARLRISDADERDFARDVLGAALDEMVEDGCRWEHVKRMASYAFIRFGISTEAADAAVENGLLRGKVVAPNRAARRKKSKKR